jgi:hypothetical protein
MRRNSSKELSNTPTTVNVMTFPISNTSFYESVHAAGYPKIRTNRGGTALRANTFGFTSDSERRQLQSQL